MTAHGSSVHAVFMPVLVALTAASTSTWCLVFEVAEVDLQLASLGGSWLEPGRKVRVLQSTQGYKGKVLEIVRASEADGRPHSGSLVEMWAPDGGSYYNWAQFLEPANG